MATHSFDVDASNFDRIVLEGSRTAPVVIDFWAPWCGPCRALKPILEKLAQEYAGRFTLAKINSDECPEIAARFNVRGIPAVKAVVDGKLVDEFVGAQPESQVRAFIEGVLPTAADRLQSEAVKLRAEGRAAEALAKVEEALANDPRHAAAQIERLELLVEAGRTTDARAALAAIDPLLLDDVRVAACKAHLAFTPEESEVDVAELERRIAADPGDLAARLSLARQLVRAGAHEPALAQLLEIVRRDRRFGDDVGRKTMLEVFNLLGSGSELVSTYRRLLAGALY